MEDRRIFQLNRLLQNLSKIKKPFHHRLQYIQKKIRLIYKHHRWPTQLYHRLKYVKGKWIKIKQGETNLTAISFYLHIYMRNVRFSYHCIFIVHRKTTLVDTPQHCLQTIRNRMALRTKEYHPWIINPLPVIKTGLVKLNEVQLLLLHPDPLKLENLHVNNLEYMSLGCNFLLGVIID